MKNDKILVTKSKERFETICGLQHMQSFLHLIRTTMKGLGYFTVVPSKMVGFVALNSVQGFLFPNVIALASFKMYPDSLFRI